MPFTAINLSDLPAPDIIETLDYETILAEKVNYFLSLSPDHDALVESDPVYKLCESFAYRELVLRQRINDAAKAMLLAQASGNDLDNIWPQFVVRQTITPADLNAVPPIEAVYESDDSLRRRKQLAMEGYTSAGSIGAYTFFGLSASPQVKDISATQPTPGTVLISVLSNEADGTASPELINTVNQALSAEDVRPLCDTVITQSSEIVNYSISATLTFLSGPDRAVILAASEQAIQNYTESQHANGVDITISGIHAALHKSGVHNVQLHSPTNDIINSDTQAPFCTSINLVDGGIDE